MTPEQIAELEALAEKATPGDLATASERSNEGWLYCPICDGTGEVDYVDYCNFDHKALGVQFYGVGDEFGVHEKLWSLVMNNLPAILAALKAQQPDEAMVADLADEIEEAISDTLDMDWQPSWAVPNILAIINRERRAAIAAMQENPRDQRNTNDAATGR